MNDQYEVEAIYLDERGMYASRKYLRYESKEQAEATYKKSCQKYADGSALIIFRKRSEVVKTFRGENIFSV
jgi:hypothetical protein